MKRLPIQSESFQYIEGRALKKAPVELFSEGASLQGGIKATK